MRIPLLVTLWFGAHLDPGQLRTFIDDHRHANQQRLDYYQAVPQHIFDANPYLAAVIRFGIAYEQAVLAWMDQLDTLPGMSAACATSTNRPAPRGLQAIRVLRERAVKMVFEGRAETGNSRGSIARVGQRLGQISHSGAG